MVALRCYLLASGSDAIWEWCAAQSGDVRGTVNGVLEALQAAPRARWRRKRFAILGKRGQSECRGLGEIRIEVVDVHYRIFGFFSADEQTFTMLLAFAKDRDPTYSKVCPMAQTRKAEVENDTSRADDCQFPTH